LLAPSILATLFGGGTMQQLKRIHVFGESTEKIHLYKVNKPVVSFAKICA